MDSYKIILILLAYIVLIFTSGIMVRFVLSRASHKNKEKIAKKDQWDTGFIIGKCENILILTFIIVDAYTALALIFAAKVIIRQEDIKKNSLYYLAGNMVNVTYSLVIGIILKSIINDFII